MAKPQTASPNQLAAPSYAEYLVPAVRVAGMDPAAKISLATVLSINGHLLQFGPTRQKRNLVWPNLRILMPACTCRRPTNVTQIWAA